MLASCGKLCHHLRVGIISTLRGGQSKQIDAQLNPYVYPSAVGYGSAITFAPFPIDRQQAMSVPSVARARNVIVDTMAGLPLELWSSGGRRLADPTWLIQPDDRMPRPVTIGWTIDDLCFYGVAYWAVTQTYKEDQRPSRFTRIDPRRVTYDVTNTGYLVSQYYVDGNPVPQSGVGSLVTFQGLDEGVLARGGRTISTAVSLERAAYNLSQDPVPSGILKNTGADLTEDQVTQLLGAWKAARQAKSTAYLNSSMDFEKIGLNSEEMGLNAARQYIAGEIARMMNVPGYIVSADQGSGSTTYYNAVETRRDLRDYTLRGYVAVIEHRLSMNDITPIGQYVRFGFDDYLRGTPTERVDVITKMLAAGIIDINEARAMEDLAPRGMDSPEPNDPPEPQDPADDPAEDSAEEMGTT